MVVEVNSIEELKEHIVSSDTVGAVGGGSKPSLSCEASVCTRKLTGIVDYRADEFTLTALSGTPIAELDAALAEQDQYLPFDPPLAAQGATLGGTVASGIAGPGRWRYGGIRDFIISAKIMNGVGEIITGGAKVVKNAAGFDLPKLIVGGRGRLGVLTELTFKVFPRPKSTITLALECAERSDVVDALCGIASGPWDLLSLEMAPPRQLWVRLGGMPEAIESKLKRFIASLPRSMEVEQHDNDEAVWDRVKAFQWCRDHPTLVKIAITPRQIHEFEEYFQQLGGSTARRYGCGGNVLYLACDSDIDFTHRCFVGKSIMPIMGDSSIGHSVNSQANPFYERLCSVFDPHEKFLAKRTVSTG